MRMPGGPAGLDGADQPVHVLDRLALGQLEDDPPGVDAVALQQLHERMDAELVRLERPRREVEGQAAGQAEPGERGDRRRQAGEVELDGAAERLGRGEQLGRVGEAGPGHRPDERLEAARLPGAQVEDRLEDRDERADRGDAGDHRRATGDRTAPSPGEPWRSASKIETHVRPWRLPKVSAASASRYSVARSGAVPGHRGDADRERPRLRRRAVPPAPVVDAALEGRREDAAQRQVGAVGVDAGHQDRELVATDPEDLVARRRPAVSSPATPTRTRSPPTWPSASLTLPKSSRSTIASASRLL